MKEKKYVLISSLVVIFAVFAFVLMGCNTQENNDDQLICPGGQIEENGVCITEELDTTPPVISGISDVTFDEDGVPDYLAGITASDDVDGNLIDSIIVDSSAVDLTVEGSYPVTLLVSDSAGNVTTESYIITIVRPMDYQLLATLDIESLDIWDGFDETHGLNLPGHGSNGSHFEWTTSHPLYVQPDGFIIDPPVNSDPVDVILNCMVQNGSYFTEVEYHVLLDPNPEVTVTSSVLLPFTNGTDEYLVSDQEEVPIYYVDDGHVPYIDISTFLHLVDGVIRTDLLNIELLSSEIEIDVDVTPGQGDAYSDDIDILLLAPHIMKITYTRDEPDPSFSIINGDYEAIIDFTENTMTINTLNFIESYAYEPNIDFWRTANLLSTTLDPGNEIVFQLGDYNIDLVIYNDGSEDNYLMPFHIANLLFLSRLGYGVYYNGEALYGHTPLDYFWGSEDEIEFLNLMHVSGNNEQDVPEDVKLATYNFMAFTFDYFYGLKACRGEYETFYDVIAPKLESYMKASDYYYYEKINTLLLDMDDLHTQPVDYGYYEDDPSRTLVVSATDYRDRSASRYEFGLNIAIKLVEKYDMTYFDFASIPEVRIIDEGKTAILFIGGFDSDTLEYVKNLLDNLPSTVENVVYDLTLNGGGDAYAAAELLGTMTDENLEIQLLHPTGESVLTLTFNTETTAYDYNWYVMTSGYTFSAANIFTSMVKEFDLGTIIGQKTGGGACITMFTNAPDGTTFYISGQNMFCIVEGNAEDGYLVSNIENGVSANIKLRDVTNDDEIIEAIEISKE